MNRDFQNRVTPGIPDELFTRGEVPITKQEIRALTLCKLQLSAEHRVIDIGAGSGGLSIECASLLTTGQVWSVERDPKALELLTTNCKKFDLNNINIIAGEAPVALEGLEPVERIMIGGSGGKLGMIIDYCYKLLLKDGLLVINCILVETLADCLDLLNKLHFVDLDFIQASISRARILGRGHCLQPLNPVYIITARKGDY